MARASPRQAGCIINSGRLAISVRPVRLEGGGAGVERGGGGGGSVDYYALRNAQKKEITRTRLANRLRSGRRRTSPHVRRPSARQ